MTTVPQPYDYLIADIPGGNFTGATSDHLLDLIHSQLPTGVNPGIESDSINIIITFDEDLTTAEKTTLDGIVPHCADFFIVTKDGGTTDLGDPATITETAGLNSATTITLRYKMGDGTNFNGYGEEITLRVPVMTIDKLNGNFSNGLFSFTVGSELNRGEVEISIEADVLPQRTVIARWT